MDIEQPDGLGIGSDFDLNKKVIEKTQCCPIIMQLARGLL